MKAHLTTKTQISPTAYEFVFSAPEYFEPSYGMNMMIVRDHENTDDRGEMRYMSMAGASKGELKLAMRIFEDSSSFKKSLLNMNIGEYILAGSLRGSFLHQPDFFEQEKPVIIAGGIGIVPFKALFELAAEQNKILDFDLIYCNRLYQDIPYIEQIKIWQSLWPNMRVYYVISGAEPNESFPDSSYISARINLELIQQLTGLTPESNRLVYFCGPDAFTHLIRTELQEAGYDQEGYRSSSFDDVYDVEG
jgi:ferredoxin-NADP reductase